MIPEDLYKLVGTKWEDDRDGYAWGCIAPMYLSSPQMLSVRYQWDEMKNLLALFKRHCKEKEFSELKCGDVLVVKLPFGMWHILVYIEKDRFLQSTEATDLEVIKLDDYYLHRIKGVFECPQ